MDWKVFCSFPLGFNRSISNSAFVFLTTFIPSYISSVWQAHGYTQRVRWLKCITHAHIQRIPPQLHSHNRMILEKVSFSAITKFSFRRERERVLRRSSRVYILIFQNHLFAFQCIWMNVRNKNHRCVYNLMRHVQTNTNHRKGTLPHTGWRTHGDPKNGYIHHNQKFTANFSFFGFFPFGRRKINYNLFPSIFFGPADEECAPATFRNTNSSLLKFVNQFSEN